MPSPSSQETARLYCAKETPLEQPLVIPINRFFSASRSISSPCHTLLNLTVLQHGLCCFGIPLQCSFVHPAQHLRHSHILRPIDTEMSFTFSTFSIAGKENAVLLFAIAAPLKITRQVPLQRQSFHNSPIINRVF